MCELYCPQSPLLELRLVCVSYEEFTSMFGRIIFTPLHSANKNSSADLLKSRVTGNFGIVRDPNLNV